MLSALAPQSGCAEGWYRLKRKSVSGNGISTAKKACSLAMHKRKGPGFFTGTQMVSYESRCLEPEHQVEAEVTEAAHEVFMGLDVGDFDTVSVLVVKLEVFVEEVDKTVVVGDGEVDRADAF
jgi:hypothetical protein